MLTTTLTAVQGNTYNPFIKANKLSVEDAIIYSLVQSFALLSRENIDGSTKFELAPKVYLSEIIKDNDQDFILEDIK